MKKCLTSQEVARLKNKVMHYYDHGGHDFSHTQRVYNMAVKICKREKENANMLVLQLASLLHDIARSKQANTELCHAKEGATMAKKILEKEKIYDTKTINHVADCISSHRRSTNLKPRNKEAKILQDADRIDALGAICIARVFMYNGLHKLPMHDPKRKHLMNYRGQHTTAINHFYEKILQLKPSTFYTKTAKKIAEHRYKFIQNFLKEFHAEWRGKK